VGQYPTVSKNEKIGYGRIATQLVVQHLLEGNQVVDEDLVSGVESQSVGKIFPLIGHCLEKAAAITLSNHQRDEQAATDYKCRDSQQQFISQALQEHGFSPSKDISYGSSVE
jgi:hypothetical protein